MDIDDDEEDEMGEMVAPTEGPDGDEGEDENEAEARAAAANSSDEEDMISPMANERRRSSAGLEEVKTKPPTAAPDHESEGNDAEFQDEEDDEEEEGDELVEIAMPVSLGDGRRNSMGRS